MVIRQGISEKDFVFKIKKKKINFQINPKNIMPEPESDKGKNMLDTYSDSSIRKQERTMSNVSLVSFHINTRGKQDTSIPSLGRHVRRKANFTNFTWGFV